MGHKFSNAGRILVSVWLVVTFSAFELHAACVGDYLPYAGRTCWDDFSDLIGYLKDTHRRSQSLKLVQPRNGQATPTARHNQYWNACFFFSIAPIVEYLGYARFNHLGHFSVSMDYLTQNGLQSYSSLDVGYYGSPEHLIAMYIDQDTEHRGVTHSQGVSIYPCGFFSGEITDGCNKSAASRTTLNTASFPCNDPASSYSIFDSGEEYGFCPTLTSTFDSWLQRISTGCGSGGCDCEMDAHCGIFWFMNKFLDVGVAGVNDARPLNPNAGSATDLEHMRSIIKAFVDHNLPLLVSVQGGGHFMTLVGYADLDDSGVPQTGILSDPVRRAYWTSDLLSWDGTERWSLNGIYPWNQHLDRACEENGWAKELDDGLPSKFKLCTMPDGWTVEAQDRFYGADLTCENGGVIKAQYFVYAEDPFISDSRQIDCDRLTLWYNDGTKQVKSATARRYQYNSSKAKWESLSTLKADSVKNYAALPGYFGPRSQVIWDAAWPENYWLVASGLEGQYPSRRTTVELKFKDGSSKYIEITPGGAYGVKLKCLDNGAVIKSYFSEADHSVFSVGEDTGDNLQIFFEADNVSCDRVEATVNVGKGTPVGKATIERQYYGPSGQWLKANSSAPWAPNTSATFVDGLSGSTKRFVWDNKWPENDWLVARNVGSGDTRGDRRTILRLFNSSNQVIRQIEIVPY
jgi:hypothetical protein